MYSPNRSSQFTVRMSRDTYSVLKRFLQDKNQSIVMNVIQEHLYVDMYEGVPRNKAQVESTAGAMEGEANRQGIIFYESTFTSNDTFFLKKTK